MRGIIKNNHRKIIYLLLVLLLIVLELFHSFIGLYYDDYGNASLSYGYDAGVSGINWTMSDLGSWASWIYMNFSGRILCGSLLNILIKLGGGPRLFMAIQPIIIVAMFYIVYRIIMKMVDVKDSLWTFIGLVALFFVLPDDMYRWNLCWASASVLYIWPLLSFFAAIYLQMLLEKEDMKNGKRIIYTILTVFCICVTAFSHEQTGLSIATYLVIYLIWQKYNKKINVRNVLFAVLGVAVYAALFFAPGNWNRMDGNTDFAKLSFFEKIGKQFAPLLGCLFCKTFMVIYFLVTLLLMYYTWVIYKNEGKKYPFISLAVSMAMLLIMGVSSIFGIGIITTVLGIPYLLCIFGCFVWYHIREKRAELNVLLIASAASAFCVLIAPTLPLRCFTEWILVVIMLLCELVCDLNKYSDTLSLQMVLEYKKNRFAVNVVVFVYLGVCFVSSYIFATYSVGYLSNKESLRKDDAILSEYSDEQDVYLSKLHHGQYAPSMPYDKGNEYIEYWMKQYYDIPDYVTFHWTMDDYVRWKESGDFYEDDWFGKEGTIKVDHCPANHINLRCYVPDDMECSAIKVTINGDEKADYQLEPGINDISVNTIKDKNNKIEIRASKTYNFNGDERDLSCVLTYYFD